MAEEKESPGSSVRKKCSKYFYYVNRQSVEADTLKDKFWRNLEEGKIDVMHTPDLYSKVKCSKKLVGLSVANFGSDESPVSTFDCSPASSCGSSTKSIITPFSVSGYETGSLLSNSPLVDTPMHSPFRSLGSEFGQPLVGFDSSGTHVTSEQSLWDNELDRSSNTSSSIAIRTWPSTSESNVENAPSLVIDKSGSDTEDTLDCPVDPTIVIDVSKTKNHPGCKRFKTKRRRNMGYSSRKRQRKQLTRSVQFSPLNKDDKAEITTELNCSLIVRSKEGEEFSRRLKHSLTAGDTGKSVRSKAPKYYYYVDAGSKEADTLKDTFWRDVDEGKLNFFETGDLYSKVKGNRKVPLWRNPNDSDTEDGTSMTSLSAVAPSTDHSSAKDGLTPVGRTRRQKSQNGRTRDSKKNKERRPRPNAASVLALQAAYIDLIKTEVCSADSQDKPESLDVLPVFEEDSEKLVEHEKTFKSDIASAENETWFLASPTRDSSSDIFVKTPSEPSRILSPQENQNDSKLLCACEVTVERLRTEKLQANEEVGNDPGIDHVSEDCSIADLKSPETPLLAVQSTSVLAESGKEIVDSNGNSLSAASIQDSDCFDNIDFDPSIPLDDLCPTSDCDFPDILELTASVAADSADNTATDLLVENLAAFPSLTVSVEDQKEPMDDCSLETPKSSSLFSKMREALMDSTNIFDINWPKNFLCRWKLQIQEALEYAISSDDHQMAVQLLSIMSCKSADLERRDSAGMTPLMQAVLRGCSDVAVLLIRRGALVNSRESSGNTPLMITAEKGYHLMAKRLLECGAHIDLANNNGETALMIAVTGGWLDLIELLLINGANFASTNCNSQTAMKLAKANKQHDIFDLLNSHINRLTSKFQLVMMQTLTGVGELASALFPLQCFSLRDSAVFSIRFSHNGTYSDVDRPILFVGHTIIGEHNVHCVLHGPCAVLKVTLNGKELSSFSRKGMFLMPLGSVSYGLNELIVHTIRDVKSELKLLVCAYLVRPCSFRNRSSSVCPMVAC